MLVLQHKLTKQILMTNFIKITLREKTNKTSNSLYQLISTLAI